MTRRMSFPAPWADRIEHAGTWHSVAWTPEAMAHYIAAGGWFKRTLFGYDPRYRMASDMKGRRVKTRGHETCKCELQYGSLE
jgi:hypothetical protein